MPDRYGDPAEVCRDPVCEKPGWHGTDKDGRLIPCPVLKKHLFEPRDVTGYDPDRISARARAAYERADDE